MTTVTETITSRRSLALVFDDRVDAEPRVRRTDVRAPGPGEGRGAANTTP